MNRLVEAEALGRVGEDVGVNRVRNVGLPVGDRAFLGGERLEDAAQPREHGQAAVLELLDLEFFKVARLGEAERVEASTRVDVTDGEAIIERRVGDTGTVRFRGADENDLDDENVPEGRVARAFRRERGDGARELVRDGGAVIRGAQGTGGEPRDTGAVLGGPGASDAQLGPSAVDDFTLGVLFVAKRDDRGFAPARVGTEFRVDVSLDNLGDGLGLIIINEKEFEGEKKVSLSSYKPLVVRDKIKSKIEDFFLSRRLSNENIFFSNLSEISKIDALRIHLQRTHDATTRRSVITRIRFRSFSR